MNVSVRALVGTVTVAAVALTATAGIASAAGDRAGANVRLKVRYTKAAGTTFAWASVGVGRPLLLLNGTGSPMTEWDPALLEELSKSRRVIVFDYPGLGASGPPPGEWTFANAADWTAAFLDATVTSDTVDVLGWSMGGFIAQRLAIQHPGKIRRLVLAGTNPGGPKTLLGPEWVQEADSDPNAGDATYVRTNYPQTSKAQKAGWAFIRRLSKAYESKRYPSSVVPADTYDAMVAAEDGWMRQQRNLTQLSDIQVPVLVTTGEQDVVTPPENTLLIASSIPGAQVRLYPGAGHSFLFQQPKKVGQEVLDFLTAPTP